MDSGVVVMWFGRELFILAGGALQAVELPEKGDEVAALVRAIESIEPRPKRVRLIYQPPDLDGHAVECPKGSREIVRSALADDHPELRNPATVWAMSRLHATDLGYATLLWVDPKARIARLRSTLATRRIALVGAWPLVSVIELTPPADRADQPVLAVVLSDTAGLVYAAMPGGARTIVCASGAACRGQLGGLIRNALSHFDAAEPPPVLVVDASVEPWDLGVSPLAQVETSGISVEQLLTSAMRLGPSDLSNLAPRVSRMTADGALWLVTALCCGLALFNAGSYAAEFRRVQNDASIRGRLARELQADNARLAENQKTISELAALRAEMKADGAHRLRLLTAIMQHKPVEVTVHAITIREQSFELAGTAHEGVGRSRGPFYQLVDGLSAGSNPWRLSPESRPSALSANAFVITGVFQ